MAESDMRWDRRLAVILALAAFFLLLLASYRALRGSIGKLVGDFCYPYWKLSRVTADSVSDSSLLAYDRAELVAKLEQLQRENRRLALQAAIAAELLQSNDELRRLSGMSGSSRWNFQPAEIILRDPLFWRESFTINCGYESGIESGAAVIDTTPDCRPVLVGVVERVSRHTSTVITVCHPDLRLSCRLGKSGAIGLLNSGSARRLAGGRIPLGFLPTHLGYQPGEAVSTTGFERHIPSGLLIGELAAVDEPDSIFSEALSINGSLKPAADFGRMRFLSVARRSAEP